MDKKRRSTSAAKTSPLGRSHSDHLLIDQMPVAMAMVDREMRYLTASKKWQQLLHWEQDLIGCYHHDLFSHLPQAWHSKAERCLAGTLDQWELGCYVVTSKNCRQWLQWTVQPWQDEGRERGGLILMVQNISTGAVPLPNPMMEQATEAIFWMTLDGSICYANEAACHHLGYDQLELLQMKINQVNPDMVAVIWQEHCQQLDQQNSLIFTAHHQTKTGELLAVQVHAHHLQLHFPEPITVWWVEDLTDKKASDAAVVACQDQLEAVLNAMPSLVSWVSSDLKYLGVNQHLADVYHLPVETFVGQEVGFLQTSPDFNQFVYNFFTSSNWIDSLEIMTFIHDEPRTYLIRAQKYQRGTAAVFVGLDITEQKKIERFLRESQDQEARRCIELEQTLTQLHRTQNQLIHTEKISSLGQIVAGVAHEINNPMSFIYGNLSFANESVSDLLNLIQLYQQYYPHPHAKIVEFLDEINLDFLEADLPKLFSSMTIGAERIRDVVKALRQFSNLDKNKRAFVDLKESLDSVLLILQNRLQAKGKRSSIQLHKDYQPLPKIECYPGQLNQALINLMTYLIEDLETEIAQGTLVQAPTLTIKTLQINPNIIQVSMARNGSAVAPEVCQHLFDLPCIFDYCTIGVSTAYQFIVEQQKGTLECLSQPHQGITFVITIPSLKA